MRNWLLLFILGASSAWADDARLVSLRKSIEAGDSDATAAQLVTLIQEAEKAGTLGKPSEEQRRLQEWTATLDEKKKKALEVAMEMAADTIQPELEKRLAETPNLKGKLFGSAIYYLAHDTVENWLDGKPKPRIWVHRNPEPERDRAFVFASGPSTLNEIGPDRTSFGVSVLPFMLKGDAGSWAESGGKKFTLDYVREPPMSRERADSLARKLAQGQEKVDYEKICQDKKLKTVFVLGPGSGAEMKGISSYLKGQKWEGTGSRSSDNMKGEVMKELADADYVSKISHAGGTSLAFKIKQAGDIITYQRVLPKSSGIYRKCAGAESILEEIIILQSETGKTSYDTEYLSFGESCDAIFDGKTGENRYCIVHDGSCNSTFLVPNLYCQVLKKMDVSESRCLALFHSPDAYGTFLGKTMGVIGTEKAMLQALREGWDYDRVEDQKYPGNENQFVPGKGAYERQRGIFEEIVLRLSSTGEKLKDIAVRESPETRSASIGKFESAALDGDGRHAAVVREDGTLELFGAADGKLLSKFERPRRGKWKGVQTLPNGSLLAFSEIGWVEFDPKTGKSSAQTFEGDIKSWSASADGNLMGIRYVDGKIEMLNRQSGKTNSFEKAEVAVATPNSIYVTRENVVSFVDTRTGESAAMPRDLERVMALDDRGICHVAEGKLICVDPFTRKEIGKLPLNGLFRMVQVPRGNGLVVVKIDGGQAHVIYWNPRKNVTRELPMEASRAYSFRSTEDGRFVVAENSDAGIVRLANIETGAVSAPLTVPGSVSVQVTDSGPKVVTTIDTKTVRVYDPFSGKSFPSLIGQRSSADARVSPDGKTATTLDTDGTLRTGSLVPSGQEQRF